MLKQRATVFVRDAGGVIMVCSMVMWALLAFPRHAEPSAELAAMQGQLGQRAELLKSTEADTPGVGADFEDKDAFAAKTAELAEQVAKQETSERLAASYGGRLGRAIEPTIEPLGFDWKMGIGLVGAFAAREVFVSTMGVVYGVGEGVDEQSNLLRDRLRREKRSDGSRAYTPLVCFSLLVFFALACQCMTTLAVVYRETAGWHWPAFLFAYTFVLAWACSLVVYQGGLLLGLE